MFTDRFKKIILNQYFLLFIITLSALIVRLLSIDKPSGLWYDEMLSYMFSSKSFPFGIIKTLFRYEYHMPLYYFYLDFWMDLFGKSDIVLRLSSVFWGVLTIPACFFLGKTYKSSNLGYFLAFATALNPLLIYYSQEVRFYSMLVFFATISIIYFLKLMDEPKLKNFLFFGLANLVILYIYTMGIVFVGLEFLFLFIQYYLFKKDKLIYFLRFCLIFSIPAIGYPFILIGYIYDSNQVLFPVFNGMGPLSWINVLLTFNNFFSPFLSDLAGFNDLNTNIASSYLPAIVQTFLLIPTACFFIGFINAFSKLDKKLLYLLLIAFVQIFIIIFLYFNNNIFMCVKYLIIIFPILLLICSLGILQLNFKFLKYILISLIFAVYIFNTVDYKHMPSFESRISGLRTPSEKLNEFVSDDDIIIFMDGSNVLGKYLKHGQIIPFNYHEIQYLDKTKQSSLKLFDKEFVLTTNKQNIKEQLIPYLTSNVPNKEMVSFLYDYINDLNKGAKLIVIDNRCNYVNPDLVRKYFLNYHATKKQQLEYEQNIYSFFYARLYEDLYNILNNDKDLEYLGQIQVINATKENKRIKTWVFVIYQKQ